MDSRQLLPVFPLRFLHVSALSRAEPCPSPCWPQSWAYSFLFIPSVEFTEDFRMELGSRVGINLTHLIVLPLKTKQASSQTNKKIPRPPQSHWTFYSRLSWRLDLSGPVKCLCPWSWSMHSFFYCGRCWAWNLTHTGPVLCPWAGSEALGIMRQGCLCSSDRSRHLPLHRACRTVLSSTPL